jgi:hypothetical protein
VFPSVQLRVVLLTALFAFAACASGQAGASFDPNSPCPSEGRFAGAYPDLEALVPKTYRGDAPQQLDSGRNCTPARLGSLSSAGVKEVRFAGGTWTFGAERALVLAVFRGDGLDADKLASFYAAGASANSRTTIDGQTTPAVAGRPGHRLDTTTSERTQTVVTWPATQPNMVNVVITNDLPDARIQDAIDAFGGR